MYASDMPRPRRHRRTPWRAWLIVVPVAAAIVFVVDGLLALAAMWVLGEFGVDAPFWPTFVGILVLGAVWGGGSRGSR